MKAIQKNIFSGILLSILFGFALLPAYTRAADPEIDIASNAVDVNTFAGFSVGNVANDPRILVKRFINIAMGFLGMLAVLVILFAGFKWMTARGDKEQLDSAHKLLVNGVIGLIIIFSAWTVAWFAVNMLQGSVKGKAFW